MTSSLQVVAMATALLTSMAAVSGVLTCPEECRCSVVAGTPSADCSGRQIVDLASLVLGLLPDTTVLDLRKNLLTIVPEHVFASTPNMSVILLDHNHIDTVQPHAFRGLQAIRLISLTGNRLTTVVSNAFSHLSGHAAACSRDRRRTAANGDDATASCTIDLSNNDISRVERQAFAWTSHLEVVLGQGRHSVIVHPYAFYGSRWMRRVVIDSVPSVQLHPRIFTNTETVDTVLVANTKITTLEQFVFEGLKDVGAIVFDRVDVDSVESYAFSGIHFRRDDHAATSGKDGRQTNRTVAVQSVGAAQAVGTANNVRQARYAHSGGSVNWTSCHAGVLATDAFRDVNVAHIVMRRTDVDLVQPHAFRGVTGLQTLKLVDCRLGNTITEDQFSSLRGLRQLHLDGLVDTRVIDTFAFRGSTDIDDMLIHFRSDHVTLRTEAFAHVSDVSLLTLRGSQTGNEFTSLSIHVGALRNLVGVGHLHIADFRLPTLERHSFSGVGRVTNLTLSNCGVAEVQRGAFGDIAGHVGAIAMLDLSVGNQLRCDCGTTSGATLRLELDQRFVDYRVMCYVGGSTANVYVDVRQMAAEQSSVGCNSSAVLRTLPLTSTLFAALIYFLSVFTVYR